MSVNARLVGVGMMKHQYVNLALLLTVINVVQIMKNVQNACHLFSCLLKESVFAHLGKGSMLRMDALSVKLATVKHASQVTQINV